MLPALKVLAASQCRPADLQTCRTKCKPANPTLTVSLINSTSQFYNPNQVLSLSGNAAHPDGVCAAAGPTSNPTPYKPEPPNPQITHPQITHKRFPLGVQLSLLLILPLIVPLTLLLTLTLTLPLTRTRTRTRTRTLAQVCGCWLKGWAQATLFSCPAPIPTCTNPYPDRPQTRICLQDLS